MIQTSYRERALEALIALPDVTPWFPVEGVHDIPVKEIAEITFREGSRVVAYVAGLSGKDLVYGSGVNSEGRIPTSSVHTDKIEYISHYEVLGARD